MVVTIYQSCKCLHSSSLHRLNGKLAEAKDLADFIY